MIAKKNRKVDLERKRFAFFQIGLLVSGSLCLAAFEYTSADAEQKHANLQPEEPASIGVELVYEPQVEKQEVKKVRVQQEIIDDVTIDNKKQNDDGLVVKYNDKINFDDSDDTGYGDFEIEDEDIVDFAQVDPEFIGGVEAMNLWIVKNIQYPDFCAEMGIGGTSYVQFVVNTDGSICMVKDVSPEELDTHSDLKAEAVRVVKKMPKWKPGENAGKKVRVRYTIPIRFMAP